MQWNTPVESKPNDGYIDAAIPKGLVALKGNRIIYDIDGDKEVYLIALLARVPQDKCHDKYINSSELSKAYDGVIHRHIIINIDTMEWAYAARQLSSNITKQRQSGASISKYQPPFQLTKTVIQECINGIPSILNTTE